MVDSGSKVDSLLHISWKDSMWVPHLNAANVLEYFSERSNPFYSRDCNNEFIKMQQNTRIDQLTHMQGVEYILLHAQDPILYIIRKQHRHSPTQVNPLAAYHIIGGEVFQTPDLGSIVNSRLVSTLYHLNNAFTEMQSYSQYHPSRGYWWETHKHNDTAEQLRKDKKVVNKEEPASLFQRRHVSHLLDDLAIKFPYKVFQPPPSSIEKSADNVKTDETKADIKTEIKKEASPTPNQRIVKPPPEKRQRTG